MATRKQFLSEVKKHGAVIDEGEYSSYDDSKTIFIDAPDGYVWIDNQSQTLTALIYKGHTGEDYQDAIDRMNLGVELSETD